MSTCRRRCARSLRRYDAVFYGPAARAARISRHRAADTLIASMLDAGIAGGAFAPVDVEATAALISDVLHGAADHITAGARSRRAIAAAKHMIRRTLEPAP